MRRKQVDMQHSSHDGCLVEKFVKPARQNRQKSAGVEGPLGARKPLDRWETCSEGVLGAKRPVQQGDQAAGRQAKQSKASKAKQAKQRKQAKQAR